MIPAPQLELHDLIDAFYDQVDRVGQFSEMSADAMPQPFRQLLNHNYHMTVTLEDFHESPVNVEILQAISRGNWYAREIVLRRRTDRTIVLYGIVRMNLKLISETVRQEVLAGQKPLGRVLIEQDVLRSVQLLDLFQVEAGPVLRKAFDWRDAKVPICFGRTAIIFCDRIPAIQLLEIVPGLPVRGATS